MACFQCGGENGDSLQLCPTCVEAKRQSHKQEQINQAVMIDLLAKDSGQNQEQLRMAAAALAFMIILLTILLYNAGAFGFGTLAAPKLAKSAGLPGADPCLGKERCVIVFLSPQSEDSVQSVQIISILLSSVTTNPKVGAQVILGAAPVEQLNSFAATLAGETYLDSQGEFAKQANVKSAPYWWIIDTKRHVINRGGSLPKILLNANATFNDMIRIYFKMDEYFK